MSPAEQLIAFFKRHNGETLEVTITEVRMPPPPEPPAPKRSDPFGVNGDFSLIGVLQRRNDDAERK